MSRHDAYLAAWNAEHGRRARRKKGDAVLGDFASLFSAPTYATPQPLLCATLPHLFYPTTKQGGICIRCGCDEPRAVVARRLVVGRFTRCGMVVR